MSHIFKISLLAVICVLSLSACSHDDEEEMRVPENILGVWVADENSYFEFCDDHTVRQLEIEYQDGMSIGRWNSDVFYYETGYNLVIYLDSNQNCVVYEIVKLTESSLVWCPVDHLEIIDRDESIGHLIGSIIIRAQEGYHLDPELYQSFTRISKDKFLDILESLDIFYPWMYE